MAAKKKFTLGISPCPNDTYIFHALLHGLSDAPFDVEVCMADVQELNEMAMRGQLDISKISAGAMPFITKEYIGLDAGAALGFGCGPLLVAKKNMQAQDLYNARIAHPGSLTTACRLLDLHGKFVGPRTELVFDQIMPAILADKVDCGIIIHEGRFTYGEYGLHKIIDFGAWWEQEFEMPLPLGLIVARREYGNEQAKIISNAIKRSLEYAQVNRAASYSFIKNNAQEMQDDVINSHINTFVGAYSLSLGCDGQQAIKYLIGTQKDQPENNLDIFYL